MVRCAPCAVCTTTTHHLPPPQGGFTFATVAGEPPVPPYGCALTNRISWKPVLVFIAAFGSSDLHGSTPSLLSYLEEPVLKGKAVGRRRF